MHLLIQKKMTKSYISIANTLTQINVLIRYLISEFKICLKSGGLEGKLGTLEELIKMTTQLKTNESIIPKDAQINRITPKEVNIE